MTRPAAGRSTGRSSSREPVPPAFHAALASLRAGRVRREVELAEVPAPQRLAPHAIALTAEVDAAAGAGGGPESGGGPALSDGDGASGRLVLLHDPAGHETWQGVFRLVCFVRADVDPQIAADPLLPGVGWTWLVDALHGAGAGYREASGTVTRVCSDSFGALGSRAPTAEVEVRASWTPVDADLGPHLTAWCELLCTAAGLAPELSASSGEPRVVPLLSERGGPRGH